MSVEGLTDGAPVVIVTGGGTGIGAAIARHLGRDHRVAICGRRLETLKAISDETGALAVAADMSSEKSIQHFVAQVLAEFGRIDRLVLNAGIVESFSVGDMPTTAWRAQIDVNLNGPFILARECLPQLIRQKGAIVSIASVAAQRVGPGLSAYSASKAGLMLLTQSIAFENARFGVRANVVCPGWTRTEMADREMSALGTGSIDAGYRKISRWVPQRRVAESSEIADVVAWLLSSAASYVNGAVINVDGGESMLAASLLEFDEAPPLNKGGSPS